MTTIQHPTVGVYVGLIIAQTSGSTTFGPASAMSYRVGINFPDGYREVEGIKPVMDRWPDTQNVVPIRANTVVFVGSVDGQLQLMCRELPHVVECAPTPEFTPPPEVIRLMSGGSSKPPAVPGGPGGPA